MQHDLRARPKPSSTPFQAFAVFHKLVPLAIVFAGLWLSTQSFARLCAYSPALGPSWLTSRGVPVYRPWMFLAWSYKFVDWPPVHGLLWQASIWFGAFSAIAIVL